MDLDSIIDINSFELFYDYVKTFMDGEVLINDTIAREKRSWLKVHSYQRNLLLSTFSL